MRFIYLSWHFSISYNIWNMMDAHPNLNIVAVFPELQPCRDQFGATYKFVGPTISEQARSVETTTSEKLKAILDEIAPRNNDASKPSNSNLKLIYVSMGTVPSNSLHVFEKTLKAIDELSSKMAANYKLKAIFSVGSGNLKKLEDKIGNGEIVCAENVLLCAKVPQLEVLKRADLFVTHCGMNSTSEAINYGVPVVCIPLEADQPMVAKRICDDLELGKRLDAKVMSVNGLVEALNEVLTNEKYKVNMVEMSKVSAKYNGLVEGRKIIENYLNLVEVS
jgi:MGT family glycosyltransferase